MGEGGVIVERAETPVMFCRSADTQEDITRTWAEVEEAVGSLRSRKFYGAFHPSTNEYWVCAELRQGDDPRGLGLEEGALPGGRYVRERLEGDPPAVYGLIKPTFDRLLEERADKDDSRPSIEFYRRHDMIDLLLPVS